MAREASDDKSMLRQVHEPEATLLIKKGAGRRPAPQKTREASSDKRDARWQERRQMTREALEDKRSIK